MNCPYCGNLSSKSGTRVRKIGRVQTYCCRYCRRHFQENVIIMNQNTNNMTEEEFRAKYDNKFILRNAVAKLEKAIYVPENEFISKCGIKVSSGYRMTVESDEFSQFKGIAPGGITYWSHPDSIMKMKNEGILK